LPPRTPGSFALPRSLHVLLIQRPIDAQDPFLGLWSLPGGFVDTLKDQDLEGCAKRKLKEKTGVEASYREQLGSRGGVSRDPRGWSATHVYFALMSADDVELARGGNAGDPRWFAIDGQRVKERLAFDHTEILRAGIARLRSRVEYTSLPAFLMPHEFTLTELQKIYETLQSTCANVSAPQPSPPTLLYPGLGPQELATSLSTPARRQPFGRLCRRGGKPRVGHFPTAPIRASAICAWRWYPWPPLLGPRG
jgi:ADP-ribose pyrophosphatase YjhB (NUDIX family)